MISRVYKGVHTARDVPWQSPRVGRGFCTRQRVKSTPSLSTCNRFEILANICDFKTNLLDVQNLKETFTPPSVPVSAPMTLKVRKPKWERALPERYTISVTGESSSLKLKVELKTTDTSERKSVNSLVDSGATGEFINRDYAKSCRFNLQKLTCLIPVYNIDGTPNKAGSITEAVSLILRYKNHSEWTTFCVTSLGKQKLILGHSWLRNTTRRLIGQKEMSKCPSALCVAALDAERNFDKRESFRKQR